MERTRPSVTRSVARSRLRPWLPTHASRLGFAIVVAMLLFAALGPFVSGRDPNASDFVRGMTHEYLPVGPNRTFWLGTDRLFRDELARLAIGARVSLFIGFFATIMATTIGACVGIIAGFYEGTAVDTLLMRIVDVGLAFPFLLIVMAVGAALDETTPTTIFITLGLTGWLDTARVVRAKTLQLRGFDFVLAARALGQTTRVILWKHVLPNVSGTLIVLSTMSIAQMILAESVLSYLGAGLSPPTATWGHMLLEGQDYFSAAPWISLAPATAIILSVLGFNLLGEGLRDALDPQRR